MDNGVCFSLCKNIRATYGFLQMSVHSALSYLVSCIIFVVDSGEQAVQLWGVRVVAGGPSTGLSVYSL